ncbi:MAG: glycosyltransferase family 2 protein [Alphaproteobacteria bacterium]|nr:glycosyltransferase family 2 protein [Alphaproteobacteria bacterium]
MTSDVQLSALVVVHNEEGQLENCLEGLAFADEIVVVLDKCTDSSKDIAARFTEHLVEGSWERDGERRNIGIEACQGTWIFEIDADERVGEDLGREIRGVIDAVQGDIFNIPVDNYVGKRLIRYGWGGLFGKNGYPGLFRKGVKVWGPERAHPHLLVTGRQGPDLTAPIKHFVDRDISDMLHRLDRYTTLRAHDLADSGDIGSFPNMVRKIFSRFWKCYVARRGYRENGYGFVIALCAALYPVLSHLKASLEITGREAPGG